MNILKNLTIGFALTALAACQVSSDCLNILRSAESVLWLAPAP